MSSPAAATAAPGARRARSPQPPAHPGAPAGTHPQLAGGAEEWIQGFPSQIPLGNSGTGFLYATCRNLQNLQPQMRARSLGKKADFGLGAGSGRIAAHTLPSPKLGNFAENRWHFQKNRPGRISQSGGGTTDADGKMFISHCVKKLR